MKRGNVRTHRKYVTEDGEKKIKYEIQGKRGNLWIPVVEREKNKDAVPMIYNSIGEAEKQLKKIVKQIRKRRD
jgi:hypothetical protein